MGLVVPCFFVFIISISVVAIRIPRLSSCFFLPFFLFVSDRFLVHVKRAVCALNVLLFRFLRLLNARIPRLLSGFSIPCLLTVVCMFVHQ